MLHKAKVNYTRNSIIVNPGCDNEEEYAIEVAMKTPVALVPVDGGFAISDDDLKVLRAWSKCNEPLVGKESFKPKNNDGRPTCAWCGKPTKKVQSAESTFDVCERCEPL